MDIDAQVDDLISSYDWDGDDRLFADFDEAISNIVKTNPVRVIRIAELRITDTEPRIRSAAAHAFVRVVNYSTDEEELRADIENLLIQYLTNETETIVINRLAIGLGFIWARTDGHAPELDLVQHPNPNVRLAATRSLALCAPDPPEEEPELYSALQALLHDSDKEVREWAKVGLSGVPQEEA